MTAEDVAEAHAGQMNRQPLSFFGKLFESLPSPGIESLKGAYQAHFVGPIWLRRGARRALALGGLSGWWGKEFLGGDRATNLVRRHGTVERTAPMILSQSASRIDGRANPVLTYPRGANPLLRPLRDELRQLDDHTLLGISLLPGGWSKKWPLPFLLVKADERP